MIPEGDVHKDIAIHIHEHVTPLRERLGKIEGRMEVHDRELTLLRAGLEALRDKIDSAKTAMLDALEGHSERETQKYEELSFSVATLTQKVDALKSWVLAIGIGAAAVFAVFEVLAKMGLIRGG